LAARKYLLGARVKHLDDGEIRNLGIVRWRHLAAKREIWRQRKAQARQRAKEAKQRFFASIAEASRSSSSSSREKQHGHCDSFGRAEPV